ncbi:conjugative transfer relaxase/helicase TraI [Vibrio sp. OPT18]|uniref:conjugative transfer relaxase/helicase TraI n=1 Tax=Vibrio sp. OPT18 TaxID=2778641 RepID=UPI00187F109C|nr:conjugative transfer relaxase/helicase TraI [Vibrio sp. OPT18]MBE8574122.1 conjugative transfer relaxase/helicase TraI [Vibrio sp. OPT18]
MLSLSPIRGGASGASSYYLAEEKKLNLPHNQFTQSPAGGYYLAQSKEPDAGTQWFGKIAEKEGIAGKPIDESKLERVLAGYLEDGNVKAAGTEQRRIGNDLTFSAPKGASILGLVYGDTRILEAHDRAVKTVLSEIEKDTAQYRQIDPADRTATYHNSAQLLFGVVPHKTSREEDPQIHSHALMANMTYDKEGNLKNLATCTKQNEFEMNGTYERILANQKYYGMLYHSEIGRDYEKMGYAIKSLGNGMIDIDGIPDEVIEGNSTRRQQILEHIDDLGIDSAKAKSIAAQETRKAKQYTPESTLLDEWQRKNAALDFDGLAFVAASMQNQPSKTFERDIPNSAVTAIDKALSHLGRHSSQLSYENLLTMAAHEFSYGKHHDIRDLKSLLDNKIEQGDLIPLGKESDKYQGVMYTTQSAIDKEKALIDSTDFRLHGIGVKANDEAVNALGLSSRHQSNVRDVLSSTKPINVVSLTGSSQTLSEALLHVGTESGRHVRFITPNNLVKQQTQESVKRQSFSVAQWVKNQFRRDHVESLHGFLAGEPDKHGKQQLLVVEQAHKLGVDEVQSLVDRAKSQQSKLVFLTNPSSRQGFKAGHAMETLQKGDVGQFKWQGQKANDTHVLLHQGSSKAQRQSKIAEHYSDLSHAQRRNVAVLTSNALDTKQLNHAIRDSLDKSGQLSEERIVIETMNPVFLSKEQQSVAKSYQRGMRLTEFSNKKPVHYEVTRVNANANTLTLKDERGTETSMNVEDRAFSGHGFMVAKPEKLEIAAGDSLMVNGFIPRSDLKSAERIQVEKMNWQGVHVIGSNGKKQVLNHQDLQDAPLSYGYAQASSRHTGKESSLWVDIPSYSGSKEVLSDLVGKGSTSLHLFTDNKDKLENALSKSAHQPSAISSVMQSGGEIEKYVNAQTSDALYHDVHVAVGALRQSLNKSDIDKAVEFSIGHVSEQKAGFKHSELVMAAIRYSFEEQGQSITKEEIQAKLDELSEKGTLLSAQYSDGVRWTTKEAIETERDILARFENGKGAREALATPKEAATYLTQQSWLSDGQKQGVTLIATTNDTFVGVQGFAGVGKSTMLEQGVSLIHHVQNLKGDKPLDVVGLAPTHAAVNELKEKGIAAQTSQSLLRDFLTGATAPEKYRNTLFLLDESSMTSNAQLKQFGTLVEQAGARAVLLGDIYQLQSKEAGKPFELAFKRKALDSVVMKDIKRQQDPTLLSAVHHVINKSAHSVMSSLKAQSELPREQYRKDAKEENISKTNVISTYKAEHGNPALDREAAKARLYAQAAAEYLSRTPESQENTLMIAYSHRERDMLANVIRHGLQKTGQLSKQELQVTRLRGVGASAEELKTMLPYKAGLIVHTQKNEYLLINQVDKAHDMLNVTDIETGEQKQFLPKHHNHQMTTLWKKEQMPLASGDKITWRKTDVDFGLKGNTDLTVERFENFHMVMKNEVGKEVKVDLADMKSTHWDYRYTRTADMAQGSTMKNVINVISSDAKLTNIRRAYIDITRAAKHAMLFTDHEAKTIHTWENNHDNNASALETIEKTKPTHERYFDVQGSPRDNPQYQVGGIFHYPTYAKDVSQQLTPYTESLATKLLGKPNASKSDRDYLVFGQGKSNLKVSLTGEHRGYFKDWTTGEKGSLLNLIMVTEGVSYKEAVTLADGYLKAPEKADITLNEKHDTLLETLPKQVSELKARALEYWETGKPIEGTAAQHYLETQTKEHVSNNSSLRFHPKVYSSESKQTHPALIAKLSNQNQQLEAIEITYLNNEGGKAELDVDKRLMGNKSKHYVEINQGQNTDISVIAVGTENAVSFSNNNLHDVDIIAVNNIHDVRTLDASALREHIIVLAGNSTQHTKSSLMDEISKYLSEQGHSVEIIKQNIIQIYDDANKSIHQYNHQEGTESELIQNLVSDINKESTEHSIKNEQSIEHDKDIKAGNDISEKHYMDTIAEYERTITHAHQPSIEPSHSDREIGGFER